MPKTNREDREKACSELQIAMKKEIMAMREILANMHQEEMLLIAHDMEHLNLLLEERINLIADLGRFREMRLACNTKLLNLDATPEERFAQNCEMLFLQDQIVALAEKINLQIRHNQSLAHEPAAILQKVPEKKRKIFLQTEERPKNEED